MFGLRLTEALLRMCRTPCRAARAGTRSHREDPQTARLGPLGRVQMLNNVKYEKNLISSVSKI